MRLRFQYGIIVKRGELMEKIITADNLRSFAYSNHHLCDKPIRGLVLVFSGLGNMVMPEEDPQEAIEFAQKGILYVIPYQNPWAWQNRQNVAFTDEIVDILFEACGLPADLPVVSTGKSMGGLSALVYMVYAKRTPVACVANCPVCDLPFHFTERPDLPRTIYSAFFNYAGSLQEAMRSASPLHLCDQMPVEASYHIFHCEEDQAVNKKLHSDRFVEAMKQHRISYYPVPGRGHCDLTEDMWQKYYGCILDAISG